jgi:hypothetical protein
MRSVAPTTERAATQCRGWYDLACGKEGTVTLRILAAVFAWLGLLLPLHVLAAASFYVGVSGALMPQMFYFDPSGGRVPIGASDVESIDGVGIGPGSSVYASTNVLGFGAIEGMQNARFSVPQSQSGGLTIPLDIAFGPDGNLYVVSIEFPPTTNSPGRVMRYDGRTGAFIDTFIAPGTGELIFPSDLLFRGDTLLISDTQLGVLRFDANTGAPLGVFIAPGSGGLSSFQQITLGPSGDLFASDRQGGRVLRYDGATGAFAGTFVDMGSGGLGEPTGLDFGSDGDLYVADGSSLQVLRYDGSTGAFDGVAGDLSWPGASLFPKFLVAVPIPEPSTYALMLAGLAAVGTFRKVRGDCQAIFFCAWR